jgi:hypothetical protein
MVVVLTSRHTMLSWVRLTSLGVPSIFLAFSAGMSSRRVTIFFFPSFYRLRMWLFLISLSTLIVALSN